MSNAKTMYALSLDQCVDLISAIGHKQTVLLQGDMGNGKSAVGYQLERKMPTHKYFYFDCTTKDLGDIALVDTPLNPCHVICLFHLHHCHTITCVWW